MGEPIKRKVTYFMNMKVDMIVYGSTDSEDNLLEALQEMKARATTDDVGVMRSEVIE